MIYRCLCEHLHLPGSWNPGKELAHFPAGYVRIDSGDGTQGRLEMAVLSHYDVRSDAAALCQSRNMKAQAAAQYFDELRKKYPVRREFPATTVSLSGSDNLLAGVLARLGFRVVRH